MLSAPGQANGLRLGAIPRKGGFPAMRNYELVCIFHADLDENALKELVEKIGSWVSDLGGKVEKIDAWGRRRLAYRINKQREGQYVLFNLSLAPAATTELEHNLRFQESVIRHLITLVD